MPRPPSTSTGASPPWRARGQRVRRRCTIDVPSELLQKAMAGASRLSEIRSAAARHVPAERCRQRLTRRQHEQLRDGARTFRASTKKTWPTAVILADLIEKVPTKSIGTGQFVIGASKVRPRVNEIFNRDEKLGIYCQFYNFQADEKTHKPSGSVEYEITKNGTNEKVLAYSEDIAQLKGSATQITIEKLLPLKTLEPGQYTLKMKVEDKLRNQSITPTATFTVQ